MDSFAKAARKSEQRSRALAMLSKGFSYSKIIAATGISHGALSRLSRGETTVDSRAGRPTVIPMAVEKIMAEKLERLVLAHMAVDLTMFPLIAKDIARQLKLPTEGWKAGDKWVRGFLQRHPSLSKRKCGKITRARSLHFNLLTHAEWYAAIKPLLELYLSKEIFNMDDTGLEIEICGHKVSTRPPPSSPSFFVKRRPPTHSRSLAITTL
jgi:hypothetical protein